MKRHVEAPPTPKRQQKSAVGPVTAASNTAVQDTRATARDLKFMEATFRVVGYEARDGIDVMISKGKDENNKDSVFQPNRRKSLPAGKLSLTAFVETNFQVPSDFETNTKYGPFSGLCFEDRLITSYEWRQIAPKDKFKSEFETENEWKMCWKCETKGDHLAREGCPKEE